MMKRQHRPALLVALLLSACNPAPEPAGTEPQEAPVTVTPDADTRNWVTRHSQALCDTTAELHDRVTTFLDAPSGDTLDAARALWRQAHDHYRLLRAGYQLAGLQPPHVADGRDPVDAWPLIPGYLDQVPGYPYSGLVYSEVPLTPDFLAAEHQSTDFDYLTLGFHPLEFMLWGNPGEGREDQAQKFAGQVDSPDQLDSPGRRRDLTRLISNQLQRSVAPLCSAEEQARLASALASAPRSGALPDDASLAQHEPPEATESSLSDVSEEAGQ